MLESQDSARIVWTQKQNRQYSDTILISECCIDKMDYLQIILQSQHGTAVHIQLMDHYKSYSFRYR